MLIKDLFNDKIILPEFKASAFELELLKLHPVLHDALLAAKPLYPNNPYHNFEHALLVTQYIFKNYKSYRIYETELPFALIAAIFHDAMHSGTYKLPNSDKFNVQAAKYYCMKFLKTNKFTRYNKAALTIAARTIECTEYSNNTFPIYPLFNYQKIIRDADILSAIEFKNIFKLLDGLRIECNSADDAIDFCTLNLKFLARTEIYNHEANEKKKAYINRMLGELHYMIEDTSNT